MNDDRKIAEMLMANSLDVSPTDEPAQGTILLSVRKYYDPEAILLQEREGVWHARSLHDKSGGWEPVAYYEDWMLIWKKYAPLRIVSPEEFVVASLEEYIDLVSWGPRTSG